ncbi:MAG TPA: HNH endonuclease signature motif containing protein [Phototrophicaceae bacterium]|nr:HNH endonuclease signature motif containing protein [Phototrophicaceae bacterium]
MSYIPEALRLHVIERAYRRCEYCLLHQDDTLYAHEVDHIIPEKHRGATSQENLCLACLDCNRHKGSDFASFDPETGEIALLFNPREHVWTEHFRLHGARIEPLTAEGRVTVFVLKLNDEMRLRAREALLKAGRYPPSQTE